MLETVLRSDELPVADRFGWWCDFISRTLMPTTFTSDQADDFRATARLLEFGTLGVSVLSQPTLHCRRTPALIRRSDPDHYQMTLMLRGGSQGFSHCRRDVLMQVGDVVLSDTSHPFDAWVLPEEHGVGIILLSVPREEIPLPAAKVDRLLAVPLPGTTGMGALLSHFVTRMAAESASCRPQDAVRLGSITLDLITAFLAHHVDLDGAVPPESRQQALMTGIHSFIETNLADPHLSPTAVAAAHHISVRYLHRLFQQQGTSVSSWIRRRRLERCRRDLAEPQLSTRPVHAIGTRWGFSHAADFSRAFRAAYGVPPGDYRKRASRSRQCADRQELCTDR